MTTTCEDLQRAVSALTFLEEECDYSASYSKVEKRRFRCYEESAIVAFARPFETAKGSTTLGLRALGVRLTASEKALKDKTALLRNKVVAHSDADYMHFKLSTFKPFSDKSLRMPTLIFDESLLLESEEVHALIGLAKKLLAALSSCIYAIAQDSPGRLEIYKAPVQLSD